MTKVTKQKTQINTELLDDNGSVEGNKTVNSFHNNSKEVLVDDNGYLGLPSMETNNER